MIARLTCWINGSHVPERVPNHSAFRCRDCGATSADMAGHVPPVRRIHERGRGTTRTDAWEPGRRGW